MKNHEKDEHAGALVPVSQIKETTPAQYLQQLKGLLAKKMQKEAFQLMQQAHIQYPQEPYLLSYYGWLQAAVDKRYRSGVETCSTAVALVHKQYAKGKNVQYGPVYLNLVRSYVAAGKKKHAIEALHKGLKYDAGNKELQKELDSMGRRKKEPVPFLDRSNPINKVLGLIRHKIK